MKRLYVGCRVRILWSRGWPELAGQEGRIVPVPSSPSPFIRIDGGENFPWAVAPDSWGSAIAPYESRNGGGWFGPLPDQLEPIIDPGHQVISWADMADLWTPSGVEA